MQLFRSMVTIIVVGTMAAMIFSLRSELAVAKAKALAKDGEAKSVIADRPHVFSMSCKVPSCNKELNTPEGRARAIEWFRKNHITKLWLESYRHAERVAKGGAGRNNIAEDERDIAREGQLAVAAFVDPPAVRAVRPLRGQEIRRVAVPSEREVERLAQAEVQAATKNVQDMRFMFDESERINPQDVRAGLPERRGVIDAEKERIVCDPPRPGRSAPSARDTACGTEGSRRSGWRTD